MTRTELLLQGLDIANLTGLEVGPLATPLVKKSEGNIIYVDHVDTEELLKKYGPDPNVPTESIVAVDAVWGHQSFAECLGGRKVDYVLASHVGEHVPDLVTWLNELQSVLNPGGEIRLALPDKRYTFDALREETRISDMITAHLLQARRPQVRDVLDFRLHFAPDIIGWPWAQGNYDLSKLKPTHPFEVAMSSARHAMETDFYHDVHCSVFSSRTFASLMEKLAGFGLLNLACCGMTDSLATKFEFYVFMKPCDDREQIIQSWRDARDAMLDPVPDPAVEAAAREAEAEAARIAQEEAARRSSEEAARLAEEAATRHALEIAAYQAQEEARRKAEEVNAARQHIRLLEGTAYELDVARNRIAMLENSKSWKMTAPLRRLKSMIKRAV